MSGSKNHSNWGEYHERKKEPVKRFQKGSFLTTSYYNNRNSYKDGLPELKIGG